MAGPTVHWPRPLEVRFESLAGGAITFGPRGSRLQPDANRCCARDGSGLQEPPSALVSGDGKAALIDS